MTPNVRELTPADFASWLPLWRGYLKFYESSLTEETTQTTWHRLTDPKEPMFALGAYSENKLAGIVHIIYHRSCWTTGDYCYLQDLFTAEDARGQGVATALIEAVYARAKADGASRVHWLTHETNATAQKLYEKLAARSGFVQYRKILSL
jgi:GNAT superfamily N-acetyltransferase